MGKHIEFHCNINTDANSGAIYTLVYCVLLGCVTGGAGKNCFLWVTNRKPDNIHIPIVFLPFLKHCFENNLNQHTSELKMEGDSDSGFAAPFRHFLCSNCSHV